MSATSTVVTEEHFAYLAQRTRPEDPFLGSLKEAALGAGIPPIWISPEQASFMQVLLKLACARRVLEVGTLAGYSAVAMARALPPAEAGGALTTVEISERFAAFAREWIGRSDVADRVEIVRGDAARVLEGIEPASLDAAFLDANKAGYPHYLKECRRIVRPGGMILVDNAFAFGELLASGPVGPEVEAIRGFNDMLAGSSGIHAVIVPIGDGLWVGVLEGEA